MEISQKCHYALKALLELSVRYGHGPVKTGEIARAQGIPPRFLEIILSELKQLGIVSSQRGARGGYVLATVPRDISVGQIIRFIEGRIGGPEKRPERAARVGADAIFAPIWTSVAKAVDHILNGTNFAALSEEYLRRQEQEASNYII